MPKGMPVQIGVLPLHYDPKWWPNPHKFDPSRFSAENKKNHHPFQYMPFGLGPRQCIGLRLAMMELKITAVRLIQHFRFDKIK